MAMLSDCLTHVQNILAEHGIRTDDEISGVIARALLSKARDGEVSQGKLIAYATFKAWAYIWGTDSPIDARTCDVGRSCPQHTVYVIGTAGSRVPLL